MSHGHTLGRAERYSLEHSVDTESYIPLDPFPRAGFTVKGMRDVHKPIYTQLPNRAVLI